MKARAIIPSETGISNIHGRFKAQSDAAGAGSLNGKESRQW